MQSVVEKYIYIKQENIWLLKSLLLIHIDLLKEFGADHPAHQVVEDTYKYLLYFAGKGRNPPPFPISWLHHANISKVYFDSDGRSPNWKKKEAQDQGIKRSMPPITSGPTLLPVVVTRDTVQ